MPSKHPKRKRKASSSSASSGVASSAPQRRGVDEDGLHSQIGARQREQAEQQEHERSYNHPSAKADWSHWAKAEFWTTDEAVALSFDKDPRFVDWAGLRDMQNTWDFAADYGDRLELLERAVAARALNQRSKPELVLAWMRKKGIEMPAGSLSAFGRLDAEPELSYEQLQATISDLEARLATAQRQIAEMSEAPRRADERMIFAIATKKFQFKPNERNSAAANIASACEEAGYSVSERTVRDRLHSIVKKQRAGEWDT